MQTSPVVGGAAVSTCCGVGVEAFYDRLDQGLRADPASHGVKRCGHVADGGGQFVEPGRSAAASDRLTAPLLAAAEYDLAVPLKQLTSMQRRHTIVALGNPTGNFESYANFYSSGVRGGYAAVDARSFSTIMLNHSAVQIGHEYALTGVNTTIASGCSSGLDAIGYASRRIRHGKALVGVAGGAESPNSLNLSLIASTPPNVQTRIPGEFPRGAEGTAPTAGAALLLLTAQRGHAQGHSQNSPLVLGYSSSQGSKRECPEQTLRRSADTLRRAIFDSGLVGHDVDAVFSSANRTTIDDFELDLLRQVFGARLTFVPVYATKAVHGECFSAAGPLQCVAALYALQHARSRPSCNPNWYNGVLQPMFLSRCQCALVYGLFPDNTCAALVMGAS